MRALLLMPLGGCLLISQKDAENRLSWASSQDSTIGTGSDTGAGTDSRATDDSGTSTGDSDSEPQDTAPQDDTGPRDTGPQDTGADDTGADDTSEVDTNGTDSGQTDTGEGGEGGDEGSGGGDTGHKDSGGGDTSAPFDPDGIYIGTIAMSADGTVIDSDCTGDVYVEITAGELDGSFTCTFSLYYPYESGTLSGSADPARGRLDFSSGFSGWASWTGTLDESEPATLSASFSVDLSYGFPIPDTVHLSGSFTASR